MQFALIGCGDQGTAYANAASELGLDLAFCVDPSAAAAKRTALRFGAKSATDPKKILASDAVDAVLLCVPSGPRLGYLREAAQRGKHVLCAAPLATALAPARKALETLRTAKVSLYVAHDGRCAPEEVALLRQLEDGAIGRPGFIRIHRAIPTAHGARAIECLLPRDLDWLLKKFGASPRLYAHALHRPALSHASLSLTFANGPIVQWIATCGAPARTELEICGTAGLLQFTSDDPVLEFAPASGVPRAAIQRSSPIAHGLPARHLAHFLATLDKPKSEATCDHELAIVRGVEAALRSARTRTEVRLP